VPDKKIDVPTPQEIGDRILRNIDQVHEFLDVLKEEIKDPAKSGGTGSKKEWQEQTKKLEASIASLKEILKSKAEEL